MTWMCLICGWIYDETTGVPEEGIAAGTSWAQVPMNWTCPECGARKEDFEMVQI
jgi:rubredoxin